MTAHLQSLLLRNTKYTIMNSVLTVFYIDDDQDDREFFSEIVELIDEHAEVVTLRNGKELLDTLEKLPPPPNCLFLDINMPGMNGFEVLKKLRENVSHKELPVVMFSTSGDRSTIDKSRELGASLFVQKSGTLDNLTRSIKHALSIDWNTFEADDRTFVYKNTAVEQRL